MAYLELFDLPGAVYPRRVLIYLHEKGLINSPHIKITPVTISPTLETSAPGKPKGTLPILALPDGTFIKQSIAILEYLEDICDNPQEEWQKEFVATAKPSMRGISARERATTNEALAIVDEAAAFFGFACHKGSKLFFGREPTSPITAKLAIGWAEKNLKNLEPYYNGRYEEGSPETQVTIADCVLFSLLQFAKELYQVGLVADPELLNLKRFYNAFKERKSTFLSPDMWPPQVRELAPVWLEE
ncbi:uncharacterized protein F4822DRAFT_139032 [Hypoxylon trugodes]|uniref:uncharacterized protein n=1 Tax=Hypoxylon trugodes TaxID=326681 RepID=UPI00219BE071|nr:uncharacterized protein F4822DRAFT_139032 [Hypoxylon trugodes]KAI1392728.1 hypothetical protein F4822DRAFT_139032 [Hypoxylon trugodes]